MDDSISRQAAIDVLKNRWLKTRNYEGVGEDIAEECEIYLRALPSEQTESCEDTVSRQRLLSDLKELVVAWEKYPVMAEQIKGVEAAIGYVETIPSAQPETNDKRAETHGVCLDAISRQAAIEAVQSRHMMLSKEKVLLINDLKKLPSAEPKRGKWIQDRSGAYCCSECMEPCAGYVMMKPRDKFCKMCGAKMEGTE